MKLGTKIMLWVSGSLLAVTAAQAVTDSSNPYGRIVERNVFSLKDPPPPPPPPPPPIPKITLQGITSILGRKQVLFKFQPTGGKEQSCILNEGQRDGEVEVLAIDELAGTIKFNNHGTIQTLSMDKDAAKAPAVSVPMPGAVPRPTPTAAIPRPGANPTQPGGGGGSSVTAVGSGLRQIPSRVPRTGTTAASEGTAAVAVQQKQPDLTSEETELLIEAHKMKAQEEGDPSAAIFPPTSLSPMIEAEQSGTPSPVSP